MSAKNEESLKKLRDEISLPRKNIDLLPAACRVGIDEEENAKAAYIKYQSETNNLLVSVRDVGLCVPNWCASIGSSPDGIVNTPGSIFPHILEIKCIFDKSPVPRSILQIARDRGRSFYCKVDEKGELQLKKNHPYYYQVLGEMVTTGLLMADFVIYHPRTFEIKVLRIYYDDDDWKKLKAKIDLFAEYKLSL